MSERAKTVREMAVNSLFFFRAPAAYDEKAVQKFLVPDKAARLPELRAVLAAAPDFRAKPLEEQVVAWLAAQRLELKDVAQPARVAVTGRSASPGLFEVLEVLGRERALARFDHAIAVVAGHGR